MSGNKTTTTADTETVLDNWEEMDDTDLNTKLMHIKKATTINAAAAVAAATTTVILAKPPPTTAPGGRIGGILQRPLAATQNGFTSSHAPVTIVPLLLKDDDYGGHTRRPIEPIVKILRRPEHERTSPIVTEKPRQPVKTLQQREQEYAEARLRILGAAQSPEEVTSSSSSSPQTPTGNTDNGRSNNGSQPPASHHNNHHHHHNNHHSNGNAPSNGPSIRRPLLADTPAAAAAAGIIRQPRGPDDVSSGFMFRR